VQSSAARTAEVADDAFLDSAARALPERAADVALIRRALTTRVTRRELVAVGDALKRLESSLMTSRR
jgi:two-component sensor histidine kinase